MKIFSEGSIRDEMFGDHDRSLLILDPNRLARGHRFNRQKDSSNYLQPSGRGFFRIWIASEMEG